MQVQHKLAYTLLFIAGCTVQSAEPSLPDKDPPANWKLADLNEEMPLRWDTGTLKVLAWVVVDDGEQVVERCLVVKAFAKPTDKGETYALAYLVRHPKGKHAQWTAPTLRHSPGPEFKRPSVTWGWECYRASPSVAEVDEFLSSRGCKNSVGRGGEDWFSNDTKGSRKSKATDGGVCRAAWKAVLDREPPTELFPELVVLSKK